ncbi:hypothetical protein [Almyronema epifaneia]|uniref:Uncharacterized protein n=1 Tax=Almyronema epifaneia S1 TaxID=2991925 RepID=A0ABW6ILW9_9CYAN
MSLILPGTPEYNLTLSTALPPDWVEAANRLAGEYYFVAEAESGLLRPASADELEEYIYGGEYEERLENSEQYELLEEFLN